jgi:hypothetical protein
VETTKVPISRWTKGGVHIQPSMTQPKKESFANATMWMNLESVMMGQIRRIKVSIM